MTASTTATAASAVGTYAIVPAATGATLGNYTVVMANGTLTVNSKAAVVTSANNGKVYGTVDPTSRVFRHQNGRAVRPDWLTRRFARLVADTVARLHTHGAELVGELAQYEDIYRLCYVRGPEGLIVELAERLDDAPG